MHPLLFSLGSIPIHTYGFLIALGFLIAVTVVRKLSNRAGLNADRVVDLTFWLLMVGFVGARILFVITQWSYFSSDPLAIFKVWEGGLVFYGGLIASTIFCFYYLRKHRLSLWKTMDALVPGLVVAHAFGRFGCLSAGCCYGRPTDLPWGVRLHSEIVEPMFRGIPLHPTQLYEAFSLLILFFGLFWIFNRKHFDGQVVLSYFVAYPIIRSIVEIFRGDSVRKFVIEDVLSTSQFISILVFAVALVVLIKRLQAVQRNQP